MRFSTTLLVCGVCMFILHSCSTCSRQQTVKDITIDLADLAIDSSYVIMAQKVFYALPTPIEMSMMVKNLGVTYQSVLLNDPANASKYLTHQKMALNFGAYITDLTYAGLFDQSQTVLNYKQSIQQLAEGLGLLSSIDPNTMEQLEANIHNKTAVMQIISETYASCTASLNEDDRYFLTLAMLVGGWVEGMYIATSMTDEKLVSVEKNMKQLVIDQKLTFDMIWQALSDMKTNPDIASLMNVLTDLAYLYDKVSINQTPNTVTSGDDGNTNISSMNVSNVTQQMFAEIKDQIQVLRHNFTKK